MATQVPSRSPSGDGDDPPPRARPSWLVRCPLLLGGHVRLLLWGGCSCLQYGRAKLGQLPPDCPTPRPQEAAPDFRDFLSKPSSPRRAWSVEPQSGGDRLDGGQKPVGGRAGATGSACGVADSRDSGVVGLKRVRQTQIAAAAEGGVEDPCSPVSGQAHPGHRDQLVTRDRIEATAERLPGGGGHVSPKR